MITYRSQSEHVYSSKTGWHTSYGVLVIDDSVNDLKFIEYIPGVFSQKEAAEEFVRLLVDEQLDIIHLHDVIEDVIQGQLLDVVKGQKGYIHG